MEAKHEKKRRERRSRSYSDAPLYSPSEAFALSTLCAPAGENDSR